MCSALSTIVRIAALTLLVGGGGGCSSLFAWAGAEIPHVNGTWTGRLVEVTVHDVNRDANQSWPAAALQVESGPRVPDKTSGASTDAAASTRPAGELLPLLSRSWMILDPAGLPVGKRVRVRGRMQSGSLRAPGAGATNYSVPYSVPVTPGGSRTSAEYIILLRGKIKVLKE